jgi:hypothetical protein
VSDFTGFTFGGELCDEAHCLRARRVDTAAGEEQVPDEAIPEIPLQAGDAAEAGNESQAKLRERETRHFIGDDDVTGESKFEAAPEAHSVNGGDGYERSGVNGVQDGVDAFQKLTDASAAL